MPALVLLGAQWGDEGKGKITDVLAGTADVVVRYQGGNNAGHTVVVDGQSFALRLLPSGIIAGKADCVIANGVVVDLRVLLQELQYLKDHQIDVSRLKLSDRAHLIMPYHIRQDELEEAARGDAKIGTTKNGIGPCYMDKCARKGIRVGDLLHPESFAATLRTRVAEKNQLFDRLYGAKGFDAEAIITEYLDYAELIKDAVCDTSWFIEQALNDGKKVVFEGAQGTLLDLDHGTYPYVTSSSPIAGSACVGAGIGPQRIEDVLGIVKAYTTRVGEGPFPTELTDDIGYALQEAGHEFGTVTGRTRRCGWLDLAVVKYAARISGMTRLALMKVDVLDGIEEIKVCVGYELDGQRIHHFPASLDDLGRCQPIYESFPGWMETTSHCRTFEDLPKACQAYITFIEAELGLPVDIIAVGPGREETVIRRHFF